MPLPLQTGKLHWTSLKKRTIQAVLNKEDGKVIKDIKIDRKAYRHNSIISKRYTLVYEWNQDAYIYSHQYLCHLLKGVDKCCRSWLKQEMIDRSKSYYSHTIILPLQKFAAKTLHHPY